MTWPLGGRTIPLPDRFTWTFGDLRRFKAAQRWTDREMTEVIQNNPTEFNVRLAVYIASREALGFTEADLEAAEPGEALPLCQAINERVGSGATVPVDRPTSTPSMPSPSGTDGVQRSPSGSVEPS